MIDITINNKKYFFEKNLTVLQACEMANIEVPKFCFHDKLSVAGNCRMCLVEIEKSPKPVASCAMPIAPGMRVYTDTPLVKKARESVLEFLLINHPLDCPICDQGGECDLQDQALNFGSDRSRFFEFKRGVEDKECGPIIKTIMTRCIHCTRCVRFSAEIAGNPILGTIGRGEKTEIGTYVDKFIKTELSGNLVDLCPVGALTSKPYAYRARSWELRKIESVDCFDAVGSNINIFTKNAMPLKAYNYKKAHESKDEIMRILPKLHEDINENWISDKTRYAFDSSRFQRLVSPKILRNFYKKQDSYWGEILEKIHDNISFNFANKKNKDLKNIMGLVGSINNIETIFFFNQFLKLLGSNNFQCEPILSKFNLDAPFFYKFNSSIKNIDEADLILLVGTNPRFEASMVNTRIKKQVLKTNIKVGLIGVPADLTYPIKHLGISPKILIEIAEGRHNFCKDLRAAKNPLIIVGSEIYKRKDAGAITNVIRFIAKKSFLNLKNFKGLNILQSNISQMAACEIGAQPGIRSTLHLNNSKDKEIDTLFLINTDTIKKEDWLSKKTETTVISHNTHKNSNDGFSDFIMPATTHYEKNGHVVNIEGRIQKSNKSTTPPKNARDSEDFFKALIKLEAYFFNDSKKYVDYFTNKNLYKEIPNLNKLNTIINDFNFNYLNINESQNKVYLTNFKPLVTDFYMTDSLSKNSQVMAECSLFLTNRSNFIKYKEIPNEFYS